MHCIFSHAKWMLTWNIYRADSDENAFTPQFNGQAKEIHSITELYQKDMQ